MEVKRNVDIDILDFAYDLYQKHSSDYLTYIFRGIFSSNLTGRVLNLTESNVEQINETSKIKKRVFSLLVESLQNITKHQAVKDPDDINNLGCFIIQRIDSIYYFTSGNLIKEDEIDHLESKLKKVNSLEGDKLKSYYKEILLGGKFSEKGGAGLGLIDMARKSGHKLIYRFQPIIPNLSYFYLQTKLPADQDPETVPSPPNPLESAIELSKLLETAQLQILYHGFINQENVRQLVTMAEVNISHGEEHLTKKRVFHIIVELLQNVANHGAREGNEKEGKLGIFLLGKNKSTFSLIAGNKVTADQADYLKETIDRVNNYSEDELDEQYEKVLVKEDDGDSIGAGLGLIDMRIKTKNKLEYKIFKMNKEYFFYVVKVQL